jgi:hypothetical protein
MKFLNYSITALVPCALAASLIGCQDDSDLQKLYPTILVCADEETEAESCNLGLNLGERPMNVEYSSSVSVRNIGDASLRISSITSSSNILNISVDTLNVNAEESEILEFTLVPSALGDTTVELVFTSDDPDTPQLTIPLLFLGIPEPAPILTLCLDTEGSDSCGTDVTVDFGLVRRSQLESRIVFVRNLGNAPLDILNVELTGEPSVDGEFVVATSTRPGELPPGANVSLIMIYEPADGTADEMTLVFTTTDPNAPEARIVLQGYSEDNEPPIADARDYVSQETSFSVTVGETVVIDGTGSEDPEGDPLQYAWTMSHPLDSESALDSQMANRVSFVPDRAGTYSLELTVTDSLGQISAVPAVALVQAQPHSALKVHIDWSVGGDIDLHLIPASDSIFGDTDCYFENPRPDHGIIDLESDDPELLDDAQTSPGQETINYIDPADGDYNLYVHYFDSGAGDTASVNAEVVVDDASIPLHEETRSLQTECSLWHIGTISFPSREWTPSTAGITQVCP